MITHVLRFKPFLVQKKIALLKQILKDISHSTIFRSKSIIINYYSSNIFTGHFYTIFELQNLFGFQRYKSCLIIEYIFHII